MVFRPSATHFNKGLDKYIQRMESKDSARYGIAKVIPPKSWVANLGNYEDPLENETRKFIPIKQTVQLADSHDSIYRVTSSEHPLGEMTGCIFKEENEKCVKNWKREDPLALDYRQFTREFWHGITRREPLYGVDVPGTLFPPHVETWNLSRLGTMLDEVIVGKSLETVQTPFLYFGGAYSSFAAHIEDMNLYSINFLHGGAAKVWWSIATGEEIHFEKWVQRYFPKEKCPAFLRHKSVLINLSILQECGFTVKVMVQEKHEFIITHPHGYHWGVNVS